MIQFLVFILLTSSLLFAEERGTYAQAGVDIDAGNALIARIAPLVRKTARLGADAVIGGFGGIFDLAQTNYRDPLLISTTDGVGTKLEIARTMHKHDTIGIDLVAMCVNDLIVHGAEPIFFLDYFASGSLKVDEAAEVISGIVKGCQESGCALSGGETAEMPGMYSQGEYDLAGFAVGLVERNQLLPRMDDLVIGDVVIGLASSGVHSNGYSLVRHYMKQNGIPFSAPTPFPSNYSNIGEALLQPTKIYVRSVLPLIKSGKLKAIAHITGGGLLENIPRVLPKELGVELDMRQWEIPPIFQWIAQMGKIDKKEMLRTFNLGIGMILIVSQHDAAEVQAELKRSGETSWVIGSVISVENATEQVRVKNPSILIIGDGAREHALAWKVLQSLQVDKVWVAPGNGGTANEKGAENLNICSSDIDQLVNFALDKQIDLTIVGPESALAMGIVDAFSKKGLRCFGPTLKAAQLETSKVFSKEFMQRHKIPTARYAHFTNFERALDYIHTQPLPLVIKADGLASGKGVVIAQTEEEAIVALKQMMIDKIFGSAGEQVVIEEYLEGEEVSFIAITDGKHLLSLETSQDHKKLYDQDQGPNTGGMGAYSPVSIVTPEMQKWILQTIMQPTIDGMWEEGTPYMGFLYAGLMITKDGPKVLEYNCRLGDPEAEPLLMRMQSDLLSICQAALDYRLDDMRIQWDSRKAISVVLASGNYPGSCLGGDLIETLSTEGTDYKIFHARTKTDGGRFITTGGRVLCITALGVNMQEAAQRAYDIIETIHWPGMHYRTDIGYRELTR